MDRSQALILGWTCMAFGIEYGGFKILIGVRQFSPKMVV